MELVNNSRETEIMNDSNITKIMDGSKDASRRTEIMSHENVTAIMGISGYVPLELSVGSTICGYYVTGVLAENTGEATLLLASKDDSKYVLKIYHKNKHPKTELMSIIKEIKSPNIITIIDTGVYGEREFEVLPYYEQGDLLSNMPFNADDIEKIIIPGINEALHALHEHAIVHRDIKPSNIFLNSQKDSVIIGDFGISSVLKSNVSVRVTNMSRTLGYAAPETSTGFISKESDYYSFGITLLHLILGQDPFAGMSEMQILYQTINNKVEIPQNVPTRIATLIKGLTVKDRAERWGYPEVIKWIRRENVEVSESDKKVKGIKPYQFNRAYYYNLESLSMAFAGNWENAKKHLYRGLVEKSIVQYGEDLASNCIDLKELADKDVAVFKLIYLLNPGAPLCFRGHLYNDLSAVSEEMFSELPEINQDIYDLFITHCFSEYLKNNNFDSALISYVDRCVAKLLTGNLDYYYALMYALSTKIGYNYNDLVFDTLEDFVEYLNGLDSKTHEQTMQDVFNDIKFPMWIHAQGYTEQVEEWINIYQKAEW